jgi:hypothetical protein
MQTEPADSGFSDRRRGRPPVGEDGRATRVSVRVPDDVYDRLCLIAIRLDISVPELIRRRLGNFGAE